MALILICLNGIYNTEFFDQLHNTSIYQSLKEGADAQLLAE